jgi:hypothetical protein
MNAQEEDVNGLATAQEVARYFDYQAGTDEDFRRAYSWVRADHDADVAQTQDTTTPEAANTVVLSCGEVRVSMSEPDYVAALAEHGLTPPADGAHSTLVVLWLAQSAQKRGLAALAKKLMDLRHASRGLVFVRRPDGAVYMPKPVTTIKVARASEKDDQATAATTDLSDEVAAFLGAASEEGDAPPVHDVQRRGRRRLRPLVRVDVDGPAALEGT